MSTPDLMTPLTGAASGFPEYTPAQQRAFSLAVQRVTTVYESFGFTPLETAAVERIDTLVSKGVEAKEVYGLRRLAEDGADSDSSASKLALRFDLTVPTARYVAVNQGALVFPFRRYQVQPVWRGERAQAGRYRQFYQFDIDTIGDGTLSPVADAEILAAGFKALEALHVGAFTLRVNNRKLLQGLLDWTGFGGARLTPAIKLIDDAEKAGWETTATELVKLHDCGEVEMLLDILKTPQDLGALAKRIQNPLVQEGALELDYVLKLARNMAGIDAQDTRIQADLTIARGLDYYTGTVVETRLHAAPQLGSIMSGGRYDNLTESLSKKKLPGVGISIGLSRLLAYLLTLPEYQLAATPADYFVACTDADRQTETTELATALRAQGYKVEQQLGAQPLGKQLQNAEKRGLVHAVIPGADGLITVKHLPSRTEEKHTMLEWLASLTAR